MPSNHLLVAAAAAALALPGCLDNDHDPIAPRPDTAEPDDPPPRPPDDDDDDLDCFEGASFYNVTPDLARRAQVDVDIRSSQNAALGSVSSTNPAVLQVTKSYEGAVITGLAPGVAALVVSRCDAPVARYTVQVSDVASVELHFPRTDVVPVVAVLPELAHDFLYVTYRAADGRVLTGTGAAEIVLPPAVRSVFRPSPSGLREARVLEIAGAGQITATVPGGPTATLDVVVVPPTAVATLSLELTTGVVLFDPEQIIVASAATTDGLPVVGFRPAFTVDPADAPVPEPVAWNTRVSTLGDPMGEVTFTATVGAASATLTHTFPE